VGRKKEEEKTDPSAQASFVGCLQDDNVNLGNAKTGAASGGPYNRKSAPDGEAKEKELQILSCAQDDSVNLGNAQTGASIALQSQSD